MSKELEKLVKIAENDMDSAYMQFDEDRKNDIPSASMSYYKNMTNDFIKLMNELRIIVNDSKLSDLDSSLPYTNDELEVARRILTAHKKFMTEIYNEFL